eukprot:maker-scaffold87_size395581-snap-gene-0.17 protein:Tk12234 transcript:maker-scaffold87_size395581-snap-gene-0.17-mRNA-1 annotation:"coiled-coil domain-containing protein 47"
MVCTLDDEKTTVHAVFGSVPTWKQMRVNGRTVRFLSGRPTRRSSGWALRWIFLVCSVAFVLLLQSEGSLANRQSTPDPDDVAAFAEFDLDDEEFEVDQQEEEEEADPRPSPRAPPPSAASDDDEAVVEDDDDEFAHLADDEEFEGYGSTEEEEVVFGRGPGDKPAAPKTISITTLPAHLRNNWDSYYLEILMAAGLVVYFLNFFAGQSKNHRLATAWFEAHRALLESQFELVGDDGAQNVEDIETRLVKASEHAYSLWCSGRVGCQGLGVELRFVKRQDLVSVVGQLLKPTPDQVQIKVHLGRDDMDSFVFCVAHKKAAGGLSKEMADLATFCPERRPGEKFGLPTQFSVMSEMAEVASAMLDAKLMAMLNKYPDAIESVHVSDQYTGAKATDDQTPTELPEGQKVLICTFNIPLKQHPLEEAVEGMKPHLLLVFYLMDKVRRYRLSREAKQKAEKNRTKVAEAFWKSIHSARAERAQEERERKKREIKDKIREMDDPDRQRKLEDREMRREKKKSGPKMKQLKVKAM